MIILAALLAILHSLAKVIHFSLIHGYVPESIKSAEVIPLFNSGDTSDVGNYRPISILPGVSKILERAVCDQLYEYLNEH